MDSAPLAIVGLFRDSQTMTVSPEMSDRREQLLAVAQDMMLETGSPHFSMADLAARLGVSRPLVYAYYDSTELVVDELFRSQIHRLIALHDNIAGTEPDFASRMQAIFRAYLEHSIDEGLVALIALRERGADSPLGDESRGLFQQLLRKLAADVVRNLAMSPREAFVLLELQAAIPESLARLVRSKKISRSTARETCDQLVAASFKVLTELPD